MRSGADRAGGICQTWQLYMYRGEIADALWRRRGEPAPAKPAPPEVEMRWLAPAEWEEAPSLLPNPRAHVSQRFADGGRCLIARRRDSGELVYHLWLSTSGAWTEWIGARVVPPDGYGLVFDVWAHPDWRRGRLHIPGAGAATQAINELGLRGMVAGVEQHEVVSFAFMYARAGLGFISPYEVLVWYRLGPLSWHRRGRPEAHLVERCSEIRRRHEEP